MKNSTDMLRIGVTKQTARMIYSLLIHELNAEPGQKTEQISLHLAGYLDRKPQEMFNMTYQKLFDAVMESRAHKAERRITSDLHF